MRLIDADGLSANIWDNVSTPYEEAAAAKEDCLREIEEAPTIDAVPVVYGRWIYHLDDLFPAESKQECSYCHEEECLTICNDNYCPNCGAKMNGGDADD